MSILLMLLLQPSASGIAGAVRSTFDLKENSAPDGPRLLPNRRCAAGGPHEIVVCGRRNAQEYGHRLLPQSFSTDASIPQAEIDLGGEASARLQGETVYFPTGVMSQRVTITLRKRF